MNRELRDLLGTLGTPGTDDPDFWRRTLLLKNYGGLPLPGEPGADSADLGFILLVVDGRGRPRHYVKCRSALDRGFERECTILERLGREPELEGTVLPARSGRSRHLRAHVSPYLSETHYSRVVPRQVPEEWRRTADEVVRAAVRICARAAELIGPREGDRETVNPARLACERLGDLARAGVDPSLIDRLVDAMDGVVLPREAQHGDLWPGNVFLSDRGGVRILDYERLGAVEVPLFDVFHLLYTSTLLVPTAGECGGPWLHLDRHARGPWKDAARALVRREAGRLSLGRRQVGVALIYAVLEMTAHRRRPGTPLWISDSLVGDLKTLDRWLGQGRRVEDLVDDPA